MQTKTLSIPTYMTAAVMGAVLCAGFLMSANVAQAEEEVVEAAATDASTTSKRDQIRERIEAIRTKIQEGPKEVTVDETATTDVPTAPKSNETEERIESLLMQVEEDVQEAAASDKPTFSTSDELKVKIEGLRAKVEEMKGSINSAQSVAPESITPSVATDRMTQERSSRLTQLLPDDFAALSPVEKRESIQTLIAKIKEIIVNRNNGDTTGGEDELIIKTSSNDPDNSTFEVESDKKSDWYKVFVFDIDTDDSERDIQIETMSVLLTTSLPFETMIDDVEIVIDGRTIDDYMFATSGNGPFNTVITFDVDGDVVIDGGDRVDAELYLRFKALSSENEGATVQGSMPSNLTDEIVAEGYNVLTAADLSGATTGDLHVIRTTGIVVEGNNSSATVTTVDGTSNDYGTFQVRVNVTAFEQDVYIQKSMNAISWSMRDAAGKVVDVPEDAITATLTSTADNGGTGNAFFEINEGETEQFTITVEYTPAQASTAVRMQLEDITFDGTGSTSASDNQTWIATPNTDYRTSVVTIVN